MASIIRDWRIDLIEAYPDLFHPMPNNPGVAEASPECGAGWRALLERACARIRAAVQADGGTFKFTQIKEKNATARLYWEGALSPEADARVEEIIDPGRSPQRLHVRGLWRGRPPAPRWRLAHDALRSARPGPSRPEKPGWENVTISHVVPRGTKTVVVKRRRYVRKADSFIEIDPLIIGEGG
jgi:hypothetical protein